MPLSGRERRHESSQNIVERVKSTYYAGYIVISSHAKSAIRQPRIETITVHHRHGLRDTFVTEINARCLFIEWCYVLVSDVSGYRMVNTLLCHHHASITGRHGAGGRAAHCRWLLRHYDIIDNVTTEQWRRHWRHWRRARRASRLHVVIIGESTIEEKRIGAPRHMSAIPF